jgi:hypothetical protein
MLDMKMSITMTPLNSRMMTHQKTLCFQDYCSILAFRNAYNLMMGI